MTGTVTKLVRSHGSTWGSVVPSGTSRSIFFNAESLARPGEFAGLEEGEDVEFDEVVDVVNGTRAARLVIARR